MSVSDAFAIATDGALIAVAAGIYTETLTVIGKSVRVWGVCPELVTVTGTMATPIASVLVREGASGTEIRNLSITGSAPTATALAVSGAEDVVIDGVWVHDALGLGVEVVNALGPTSAFITNSLVELNQDSGVTIFASTVSLTDVVIRDNGSAPSLPTRERGIDIETDIDLGLGADVEVRHAVIEQHGDHGIYASGAQLSIDSTLVRDVDARASDDLFGRGIGIQLDIPTGLGATGTITGTVIERTTDSGLFVYAANASASGLVVRDTKPRPDQNFGRGLTVRQGETAAERAIFTLTSSLVDRVFDVGVFVSGSDVTVEGLWVREVAWRPADELFGDGMISRSAATASLSDSLIEDVARAGFGAFEASATLRSSRIGCSAFPITTEDAMLTAGGNVLCACPVEAATEEDVCKAVQAGIEPPELPDP